MRAGSPDWNYIHTQVPRHNYGLEDRGPNVSPASGAFDVEPIPSYDPAIGEFRFDGDGRAVLIRKVHLRDASGHRYSGLVNSLNPTGETIEDLSGRILASDPDGYDPEGLVAMRDGTFWVSDEYCGSSPTTCVPTGCTSTSTCSTTRPPPAPR